MPSAKSSFNRRPWPRRVQHGVPSSEGGTAFGAFVGVIGFTGGYAAELDLRQVIQPMARVQGIAVGSRSSFEAMTAPSLCTTSSP